MSKPSADEMANVVGAVWDRVRPHLRDELLREVDGRIEAFRRAVYVRDEWCCNTMLRFAQEIWCAAKPRPKTADHFGSVAYSLRGHVVNYCPFCGVAFTKKAAGR